MDRYKTLLIVQTAVPREFAGFKHGDDYEWWVSEKKTLEFLCELPLPSMLDAVAVTVGPGRFTSTRVGVGYVLGLAFSRKLPVFPINVFDVIDQGQEGWYLIMSRKGEYYASFRREGRELARKVLSDVPDDNVRVVDNDHPLEVTELEGFIKRAEVPLRSWRELEVLYMKEVAEEYKLWT